MQSPRAGQDRGSSGRRVGAGARAWRRAVLAPASVRAGPGQGSGGQTRPVESGERELTAMAAAR